MDIIESQQFYSQVLAFVKEADKDKDGILRGDIIEAKFPKWGNIIFAYLHDKRFAFNVTGADVNFNKEEIPAIIALVKEKRNSFRIQFWLNWIPIAISFASLLLSIIAICK